jgi:Berberine and berberine like
VLAGPIVWDARRSARLMRFYREWIETAPDELTTIVFHRRAAPQLGLDQQPIVMIGGCYAGPVNDGKRAIKPLRLFAKPLLDLCQPKPFLTHQAMLDPTFVPGRHYYFRAHNTARLTDELIDTLVDQAQAIRSKHSGFGIFHLGGAISRTGEDDTAFTGRQATHTININAIADTADELQHEREWAHGFSAQLAPYETGVYVNFLMDAPQERLKAAYRPAKYERLRALKRQHDPDNQLHRNHNIPPA